MNGSWSGGGPMFLTRSLDISSEPVKVYQPWGAAQVDGTARIGGLLAANTNIGFYKHPSDAELDALGTTAIARTEPTNPAFDLSTFIGELRAEGIPNMPNLVTREKTLAAKNAGGDYLNVEFGWLPLVRGIRDFAETVKKSDDIVRTYQEHANIVMKRSYEWPVLRNSAAEPINSGSVPTDGGSWLGGGYWQSIYQRTWFEADYVYYLPTGGAVNDKIRRFGSYARKLYGIDLTPEVLWNLAPWSWAADWFANTGDIMHNISAIGTDGLAMRNAYVMCHTRQESQQSGYNNLAGPGSTMGIRYKLTESKTRRPGTPYGFGLNWDGFSPKQIAIIAALGISRT
nr:MAG: hypothetical protein 1 [Leviviridae sp.]